VQAPQWDSFNDIPSFSPVDKIGMRLIAGESLMVNMVTIEPGGVVPLHSHPNEQSGYVISGTLILEIDGDKRALGPGACYMIPGNVPHSGETDDHGCVLLDIFAPPRSDYVALQKAARNSG
jgi:quercetin dioxygenase-like cupin family protein